MGLNWYNMRKKLRYFSNRDNFGGIENMDKAFLHEMDIARHTIRQPCIIHCGYVVTKSGHTGKSRHYYEPCDAADFHYADHLRGYKVEAEEMQCLHKNLDHLILNQSSRTVLDILILQKLSGIKRIGIYPFGIPKTYFHADNTRKSKINFWIGLQVDGIFRKLIKYLPEFKIELESLLKKIKKSKREKVIVYISPT